MYLITAIILLGLLVLGNRRYLFTGLISFLLILIRLYLSISDAIIKILPKYIYIKTYVHKTNDLDYSVYEYWGKYNNKYHRLRVVEDNKYNTETAFQEYTPHNMTLINYCAIANDKGNYIKDVTREIRCFMHYKGLIEWKYVLINLGIERDKQIIMYMNDMEMTEKIIDIDGLYNQKFNF